MTFSEDYVAVLNLVYRYPELIDSGDFEGIGRLFAHAAIDTGDGSPCVGAAAIQEMYERNTRRYADTGTPHTVMSSAIPSSRSTPARAAQCAARTWWCFNRSTTFRCSRCGPTATKIAFAVSTTPGDSSRRRCPSTCPVTSAAICC